MVNRTSLAAGIAALLASLPVHGTPTPWVEPATGMQFVKVPKGCFKMGTKGKLVTADESTLTQLGVQGDLAPDERPQHEVCVDAFLIGQHEVRASEWEKVMGEPPPGGSGNAPAAGMTWHAAQDFASRLTQLSGAGYRFRLPTEAEWEYACRAGRKDDPLLSHGPLIDNAWVASHRQVFPSEVGKLKPNKWGIHDMLGNVWEWVEDAYRTDAYGKHVLYNPVLRQGLQGERVLRGGSHRSDPVEARCANRSAYPASDSLRQVGVRLVRTP